MQQGGFKFIIKDFVEAGGLDVVVNSEETLQKQLRLYKKAGETLLLKAQE